MTQTKKHQSGFTIIELIFATLIFSMVMTVILVSAFQIGRIYYKGVSISGTNEAARSVVQDLSDDARFANANSFTGIQGANPYYFCIGLHRYMFVDFRKVTNDVLDKAAQQPSQPAFFTGIRQDTVKGGCPDPAITPGTNPTQLLGPDMQINNSDIIGCANGACSIHLHVIFYGNDNSVFRSAKLEAAGDFNPANALNSDDASCSGNLLSSQFCAAVDLRTLILQRT